MRGTVRAYDGAKATASCGSLWRGMLSRAAFLPAEAPMRRISYVCVLLAVVACKKSEQGSGTVGAGAKGPIVVGEVGSMTGTEATFGTSSDRGIQLATKETN